MRRLPFYHKVESGGMNFSRQKENFSLFLLFTYIFLLIIFFSVILLRLFQLTISKGSYYRRLSDNNRIREITIEAKRGKIIDRKGLVLAENQPVEIEQNQERLLSKRNYYQSQVNGHLIGYRQLADEKDLKNDLCQNKIKPGDKVGKKGVEQIFDCELRGKNGKKLIEVNANGSFLKLVTVIPAVDGKTIPLAIDSDLQKKAYELIKGKKAAVIGLKTKTGEVLVFASSPSFNPQAFEDKNSFVENYLADKEKPLFDRVTEAAYPPGSIFKLVVATAALEEKAIDEKTVFEDTGKIKAGPLEFGNWYFLQYGKTEGLVNITKAIQRSNDIFFYKTGERIGPEKIKYWSEKFGLGKKSDFPFDQTEGNIPSPFWKEEVLKEQWYLGDTYNLSIGQGYILTSPLQMALVTSVFANDGYFCQPQLLKSSKPKCQKIGISKKTLDLIKNGMEEACANGGTGWPFFEFKISQSQSKSVKSEKTDSTDLNNSTDSTIKVACKTGTAELHATSGLPHAWFTAYAPAKNPEITLLVMVEEGGQGSDIAGPIAKEILKTYFERTQ